ncbi:hypothetical protein QCM77_21215 [Bradyrhizobium sp. SSUT18]|uniref:hypothetical protein n=1 Tax=unclassified Bradyrhizobium TaxID=2631580 RepID=UPI00244D451A|nr:MULTISPECIES: hypothetical protein [unclassified Bradyrhizobium]MDH2341036.1 hypothetical protein [Bradyrhizobium sp. SSUT77]MDH2354309.1 hypothetical protein [Bradyrhizobium sp. SSUT112]MDH2402464.1 hypothetical protein [Bradyrhizobium sp. SSUT18]
MALMLNDGMVPAVIASCRPSGKTPCQSLPAKIFLFTEFRIWRIFRASRPLQGRFAIVTRRGSGGGGRDCVGALGKLQGGFSREQLHTRYDTALTVSSFGLDGERTPAIGDRGGEVRGRQNRVVLTPGVCASSFVVMLLPNRVSTSAIRKATGAIVHRSPGRARHKP